MISAIVLVDLETAAGAEAGRAGERVVRSLVWLVSATVAGLVRDVTLAGSGALDLASIADQAGCGLVRADDESEMLAAAVRQSRGEFVLILRAGYQPEGPLIQTLDQHVASAATARPSGRSPAALILAAPETLVERLLPDRAPIIGIMLPRATALAGPAASFGALAKRHRHAVRLRSRLLPIA